MRAKSIKGKTTGEIQSAVEESLADSFKPTLAIVFISVKQDRKAVCELLTRQGIDVSGATSCGEFINCHQSEGETVILLLDISREYYTILIEELENGDVQKAASHLAEKALHHFKTPTF